MEESLEKNTTLSFHLNLYIIESDVCFQKNQVEFNRNYR